MAATKKKSNRMMEDYKAISQLGHVNKMLQQKKKKKGPLVSWLVVGTKSHMFTNLKLI